MPISQVPTRFDIHANSDRRTADHSHDVQIGDHHEQNPDRCSRSRWWPARLSPSPPRRTPPSSAVLTAEHCSFVEQTFDSNRSHYKSKSAFLTAEQKAMSLCRWDKHKNGGVEFGDKTASKS